MDLVTMFIAVSLTALLFSPVVVTIRKRKQQKEYLLQLITVEAGRRNSNISNHEICGNSIIGIDKKNSLLVFAKRNFKKEVVKSVNLNEYKKCSFEKNIRVEGSEDSPKTIIDRLFLAFTPMKEDKPKVEFDFYNTKETFTMSGEIESLGRWNRIVNQEINN